MRKLKFEDMQEIAASRGGRCLSNRYECYPVKLKWQCARLHVWLATAMQIKKGHWCPFCVGVGRVSLTDCQQTAGRRGGRCLSHTCFNSRDQLRWQCAFGHVWSARVSSVRSGQWCPVCAKNRLLNIKEMQSIARARGGLCLSSRYKNGKTPLLWCCTYGHTWKAWPANVKGGSHRKGSWCPECYNWRREFRGRADIESMRNLALARGGRCISTEYVGSRFKLDWQCKLGHRWHALPSAVIQGSWCPTCARNLRLTLSQFQELAIKRGGLCLSQSYVNARTPLWWRCSEQHEWRAAANKVQRGSWCPKCARRRKGKIREVPDEMTVTDSPRRSVAL